MFFLAKFLQTLEKNYAGERARITHLPEPALIIFKIFMLSILDWLISEYYSLQQKLNDFKQRRDIKISMFKKQYSLSHFTY